VQTNVKLAQFILMAALMLMNATNVWIAK